MTMRGSFMILYGAAIMTGLAVPDRAVQAQPADWTPKSCGAAPVAPKVDATDVRHFNASVDRVNAYEKAARTYAACVSGASGKEQSAISAEATARMHRVHDGAARIQKQISDEFSHLSAEMKKGHDHLATQ
ncbi:hypothetical protein [Novacetimonas cocois]|uniref:Uncharacterized protein n=1 Tax=Novacetimonas cocois TaxID=1747507 RepID=A0A365YS68_9PROT|nr:hypothetical protein [Novacetimonas cocois]RBM05292.1 hypothetical protein NJLHNGOC_13550 [Novacetimonas cocois]